MNLKPVLVDDIIRDIVESISVELTPVIDGINGVFFQQGHPLEIIAELQELSKGGVQSKSSRYPLVALFRDYPEEIGIQSGVYSEVTLNMIIACRTEPTYSTAKRKEKSFLPILYPIYLDLINALNKSPKFLHSQGIGLRHTKIDHYFWGRESVYGSTANIFKDWIDCIEIKNLKLKVYNKKC